MTEIVYGLYKNADMIEGRGPMILECVFTDIDEVQQYIKGQPDSRYWDFKPLHVYDIAEQKERADEEDIARTALSKLSEEEQDVLARFFQPKAF